ncbi:MAG TPA: hypothetical protein VMP11_05930 [Verrucomicrobiae bacterium]|nr:hypothetical protein [Verrucomicrobiae bacterium]
MNPTNVHHPLPREARPFALLLWLLFCAAIWVLGFALALAIIENLYYR